MTDKQIIVDGVDVSGCDELVKQDENTLICEITGYLCEDRQNCYYKQLLRKEQECEELKEKVKKYGEINEQETKDYAELKAENDELKKKCNIYTCGICGNKEDCNKLYKTLTEIKELIQSDYCTEIGSCEFCAEIGNCLNRKILQKISECEVE